MAGSLEQEEAARREDREAHEAALRQVQQELGALGQRAARQEAELTEQRAKVSGWAWAAREGQMAMAWWSSPGLLSWAGQL